MASPRHAHVLDHHKRRSLQRFILGYAPGYGPRQPGPEDWSVVRRIWTAGGKFIIADGGIKSTTGSSRERRARLLLAVDKPKEADGNFFSVGELPRYTMRQRIELIAKTMGAELELVDMPYRSPRSRLPATTSGRSGPDMRLATTRRSAKCWASRDRRPGRGQNPHDELALENQKEFRAEWEMQMADTWDYAGEDELIRRWKKAYEDVASVEIEPMLRVHLRHRRRRTSPGSGRTPTP